MTDALRWLILTLKDALQLLRKARESAYARQTLFDAIGWNESVLKGLHLDEFISTVNQILDDIDALADSLTDPPNDFKNILNLLGRIRTLIEGFEHLPEILRQANLSTEALTDVADVGINLYQLLIIEHLNRYYPTVLYLLQILTLLRLPADIDAEVTAPVVGADGVMVRHTVALSEFRFERLGALLTEPIDTLKKVYFGSEGLTTVEGAREVAGRLFGALAHLLIAMNANVIFPVDIDEKSSSDPQRSMTFRFPLPVDGSYVHVGARIALVSDEEGGAGVLVAPIGWTNLNWEGRNWLVSAQTSTNVPTFIVRGNGTDINGGRISLHVQVKRRTVGDGARLVIGILSGTRIDLGELEFRARVDLTPNTTDVGVEISLGQSAIVIKGADGDGFLNHVLPREPIVLPFEFLIGWSNRTGLYLSGSGGLEATIAVHKALLDIFRIETVFLAVRVSNERIPTVELIVAATASVKLGPLVGVVERLGLRGNISFPERGGNLGIADLDIEFKLPDGVGVGIDAGPVKGGGYLEIKPAEGRYAGHIYLEFGAVALNAVGLLNTIMPDGSPGFSLLVIISAEFTPVQLGFGFTWLGVGGLIGIHRKVLTDALQSAVKSGGVDSILFPKNIIENAPRIINTLSTIFPPSDGQFVIGIMGKFGWGTPTIVALKVGILIQLPDPVQLIILGSLTAVLPTEILPIIQLKCDIAATFDFGRGTFTLDASIYDSRYYIFDLSGDLAVRATLAGKPDFIASAGGYNPRFAPAIGVPTPRRLVIALPESKYLTLRLEAYVAITPNTLQFGARLEVRAAIETFLGTFSAEGVLGFDALFERTPRFRFIVDIYGGVTIRWDGERIFSVSCSLTMSGPQPFQGTGYAEIDVEPLGKKRIPIRFLIGEEPPEPVSTDAKLADVLKRDLELPGNWTAHVPASEFVLVTIRERSIKNVVFAHPLGTITVRQRTLPLNITITRFGAIRTEPVSFHILRLELTQNNKKFSISPTIVKDHFAPAEFIALTDDEKLSAPSFSLMVSGAQFHPIFADSDLFDLTAALTEDFGYEEIIIDEKTDVNERHRRDDGKGYKLNEDQLMQVNAIGAAGQSLVRFPGGNRFYVEPLGIEVNERLWHLVSTETLQPISEVDTHYSYYEAREELLAFRDTHPWQADRVQVVPVG